MRHLKLDLEVVFEQQTIRGTAILTIQRVSQDAKEIVLDSRGLQIDETEVSPDGLKYREAHFSRGKKDPILGAALKIDIAPDTQFVRIRYSTDPTATALQWLTPRQTAGGMHPFLYTQSQAIHARSWIPLQDSPGVRVTYEAHIRVPEGLKAVMGATNCTETAECHFVMDQPVPSYLIALAVGDLVFRLTGPRTGVWAEPSVVVSGCRIFRHGEDAGSSGEAVRPLSLESLRCPGAAAEFPVRRHGESAFDFRDADDSCGRQEPGVARGAGEMAHSWSGNLVTNATWSDFWLNEGYTVYIERRTEELFAARARRWKRRFRLSGSGE